MGAQAACLVEGNSQHHHIIIIIRQVLIHIHGIFVTCGCIFRGVVRCKLLVIV